MSQIDVHIEARNTIKMPQDTRRKRMREWVGTFDNVKIAITGYRDEIDAEGALLDWMEKNTESFTMKEFREKDEPVW
jgi:hypothetical protein